MATDRENIELAFNIELETRRAMGAISKSSHQIGQIIGVQAVAQARARIVDQRSNTAVAVVVAGCGIMEHAERHHFAVLQLHNLIPVLRLSAVPVVHLLFLLFRVPSPL